MCESRQDRIDELTRRFRGLLEERFPEKGSTLTEIEELTEEIGQAIEAEIEDAAVKEQGRGHEGNRMSCGCGGVARFVRDYVKEFRDWVTRTARRGDGQAAS